MRKKRAAELVKQRVDDISVEERDPDGEVVVRVKGEGTRVATIAEEDEEKGEEETPPSAPSGVRLEYVTEGPPHVERKARQIRRLLSRRAR
ncbi:hypothetical protein K933_09012 [Candidatus Halobonum tyrrellensis G22]|uniref:Uncharacterized protein n=2 Tax=Candidatus Halobonum TaxID=1431544 RepID=V4HER2_9EURY|nr:hypothetical protein K933_09012 [Candidatus Halobonum tyrrellensis G22]